MPDPSLRLLPQHPWPAPGSTHGVVLLRDRGQTGPQGASAPHDGTESGGSRGSDGSQGTSGTPDARGSGGDRDNPFAPPPEGTPDQPWRPRPQEGKDGGGDDDGDRRSPWGGQWSDRQPGRSGGRFGDRPGQQQGGDGGGPPAGMRWDPTDPAQRRARYSLLTGMWAFFFALFSWPYVALMLGALAVYWGVSAVRGGPSRGRDGSGAASGSGAGSGSGSGSGGSSGGTGARAGSGGAGSGGVTVRSLSTAAISGLVTGGLALAMVAATFTAQLVYRDYFVCVRDALTVPQKESCEKLLPESLRPLLSTKD
ncbi:hypothetical protein JNUCC64_21655 [Streptomyces sp. JNUCC 64]